MNENAEMLGFANREEYKNWLKKNHMQSNGIWIIFIKGNKQFSANDALEESICFGWIDGLMKSIDDKSYKKYFSKRKDLKKWSDKNIDIYAKLVNQGFMTQAGMDAFKAETKIEKTMMNMSDKIEILKKALRDNEDALQIYENKPQSKQKQFAGFYCDAKSDETRNKRKNKIIEALQNNYTGMLY